MFYSCTAVWLLTTLLLLVGLNDVYGEYLLQNCSVGIVGKDMPFTIYDDDPVERYVSFVALRLHCCLECSAARLSFAVLCNTCGLPVNSPLR